MVRKSVVADRGGHVKQEWVCMASHACRQARKRLVITSAQTSNATQHLGQVHKLKSAQAKAMKITKDRAEDKVQTSLTSTLYQDDPDRFTKLEFVKAIHIVAMIPFAFPERPMMRHLLSVLNPMFDTRRLHHKSVRTILTEIIAATCQSFAASMLKTIRPATIPIALANVDLWTSKVSREKYIGHSMDFHLLAVVLAGLAIFLSGTESAPCLTDTVDVFVTSAVDVKSLADVMNCTGQGDFNITWYSNLTLGETIEISDLKSVTMTGVGFPTIHGGLYDDDDGRALVNAGGGTGIFSVSGGSNLSLNNLVLEGGNTENGAAVNLLSSSNLFAYNCFFVNNIASFGGAIYASHSSVDVHGSSTFTNNYALQGGAVYAWKSNISIGGNTSFSRNTAEGSILISTSSGSTWPNSSGGAIYAEDSKVHMDGDCSFADNSADNGGAMYGSSSSMSMEGNIMFANNHAVAAGGAMNVWDSEASMDGNISFANNLAEYGGAMWVTDSEVYMDGNILFANNSALQFGGAMYVFFYSFISMEGINIFASNSANYGGAMMVIISEVYMDGNILFSNNSALLEGGAVAAVDSSIIMNRAMNQSGYLAGNEGEGCLDVEAGPALTPTIWFIGNTADVFGGAILIQNTGQLECTGVSFELNNARHGGAIFVVSTGTTSTQFCACVFERNKADEGGALYFATGSGVDRFASSVFRDNFAKFSGGAIFHTGSLRVVNTRFEANMAGVEGPAIISIGLIQELSNVTFSENSFYCRETKYGYVVGNESYFCSSCFEEVCARCSTGHLRGGDFRYIQTNGKPVCEVPPAGTTAESSGTTIATLSLDKGYFRSSNQSRVILKCFHQDACVGGSDAANYCESGYSGPYCAVCVDGYTPGLAYSCNACSTGMTRSALGITVAVALAALLLTAGMFAHLGCVVRDGAGEDTGAARRSWGRTCWSCQRLLVEILPLRAIKIVITVWQIISQFDAVAGDVYPELYKAFVSKLTAFNLDLDFVLSYSCLVSTDFYHHLLVATIAPLGMLVMLAGSYLVAKKRNDSSESAKRAVRRKHQSALLYFAFFIYSPVSYKVLQTFSCDELDDENSYLRADYSLSCLTRRHSWFKVYALIMVGIYPLGIAAVFAFVLAWYRHDLVKPDRESVVRLKPFHDVWAAYKPSRYFYEVVECSRRVSLIVIAAFVPSNSATQVSMALMFAVVWVFISEALSPFAKHTDMMLYRWGNGIIVGSMYVAFLAKVDVGDAEEGALLTFSGVLILANVFMVVTVLLQTALVVNEWHRARFAVVAFDAPVRRTV